MLTIVGSDGSHTFLVFIVVFGCCCFLVVFLNYEKKASEYNFVYTRLKISYVVIKSYQSTESIWTTFSPLV